MYITRVFLKRLPTPNIIHGLLSSAFPGERNNAANENLWRTDDIGDSKVLIIVSESSPEIRQIVSEIGANRAKAEISIDDKHQDKTIDYDAFLKHIETGQEWNFRLCANPIEHVKQNTKEH